MFFFSYVFVQPSTIYNVHNLQLYIGYERLGNTIYFLGFPVPASPVEAWLPIINREHHQRGEDLRVRSQLTATDRNGGSMPVLNGAPTNIHNTLDAVAQCQGTCKLSS